MVTGDRILLGDSAIAPQNGKTRVIPGTHQRWDSELERNVRLQLNGHTHSEELPGSVLIQLKPGDILLFSGQMIHRGNYKLNRVRQALDICVGKKHPLTSGFLDRDILPNSQEIRWIDNNQWYKLAIKIAAYNIEKSHNSSGNNLAFEQ